jgi:uncharacterized protein
VTQAVVLLDTGPLVAALSQSDLAHAWAKAQFAALPAPFLTCEAVISEACFLLRRQRGGARAVLALLESGALKIGMDLSAEISAVRKLFEKYDNVPASLADACLIRMSELYDPSTVLTLDSDFHIYRRHGRKAIPVIQPGA